MYHPVGEEILAREAQVTRTDNYDPDNLKKILSEEKFDAVVLRAPAQMTRDIIEAADSVKAISGAGAGLDNIDVEAATEKGIAVLNCPTVNAVSVAEHALTLMLTVSKKILPCDQAVRKDNFELRNKLRPTELNGKVLGLVGIGAIGSKLAKMVQDGLNMSVKAFDPYVDASLAESLGIELLPDLDSLLPLCDVLSLHVPLLPETKNIIGEKEISLMKPTAIIINTARGGILDEEALTRALIDNRIAGAGLDVFCTEPNIDCSSPLYSLDNTVFSPHLGGITEESTYRMAEAVATNILAYLEGNFPETVCNANELDLNN